MALLRDYIRDIPDFPQQGIVFKDITPLLKNPDCLQQVVTELIQPFRQQNITAVVGIEARGFIFAAMAAWVLQVGFVPLRKAGKLPYHVLKKAYTLEYAQAQLEIHSDALTAVDRVLLIDDVLATGGTAKAGCDLVHSLGASIIGCAFVIELDDLQGKIQLKDYVVHSLLHY
ncbi:MAG: hypothetical protein RL637_1787 [Pseudomonadota bacterium]|jgi:adenine phosphoribosyltransferase